MHNANIDRLIRSGITSLSKSQSSHCSERRPKTEITEANLTHHIGAALINAEYNLYAEFPIDDSKLIDLVAFCETYDEWIAIEAKSNLHSNQDKVLDDFDRLENIKNEEWTKNSKVMKVMLVMNRHPILTEWWKSRGSSTLDGVKAAEKVDGKKQYKGIQKYLKKYKYVDSFAWYEEEENWVYEVMYAIS